jgi:hypothetical protein
MGALTIAVLVWIFFEATGAWGYLSDLIRLGP